MTAAAAPVITYGKLACGLCQSGLHDRCPIATWNPGSGKVVIPAAGGNPAKYAGEALYCPCTDQSHGDDETPRCRNCGHRWGEVEELNPDLTCLDAAGCALRIEARLAADPLHQLILQCRTTRLEGGEVVERKRRPTPVEKQARKVERAAAKQRPCTCGCEGVTKGGAFLPGHDARFVSQWVRDVEHRTNAARTIKASLRASMTAMAEAREALAPFPKLLAKFEKRM